MKAIAAYIISVLIGWDRLSGERKLYSSINQEQIIIA